MPQLVVRSPGQPDQTVPLREKPLVVGRAEDADVWIAEKKSSRRHLRISRLSDGSWVAEDLGSANGTFFGERRVLRVALRAGDVLRIGDTTLELSEPAAAVVGGTLELVPVGEAAPPPPAAAAPAPEGEPLPGAEPARLPMDRAALGRSVAIVAVAVAALVGIELFLGRQAAVESDAAKARSEARAILDRRDLLTLEQLEEDVTDYVARFPRARDEYDRLRRFLDLAKTEAADRARAESRLNALVGGRGAVPDSELRTSLLALLREREVLAGEVRDRADEELSIRIREALSQLDRDRDARAAASLDLALGDAREALAQGQPAAALRALAAFRAAWPLLPGESRDRLVAADREAVEAVERLAASTLAAAAKETDPERRRAILAAAWPGLEGTVAAPRLEDEMRFARPGSRPSEPGTPGTPPPPEAPALPTDLLARAAEAEKDFGTRRWTRARAEFEDLLGKVKSGLLHDEWQNRVHEIDRILALVSDLDGAAKGATPPRRKLSSGPATVVGADASGVSLASGDEPPRTVPWPEVPEKDVVKVLAPDKPTEEQRLAVALLAASVGDTEALVKTLLPFYEKGPAPDGANRIVARYLYGRSAAPEGGYLAYGGEILDRAGYERKVEAERLAALRARAEDLLAKVAKDPAFHSLEKMRKARAELDERRRYALLAIFDEKHYPYPYQKGSRPYQAVQKEVDRRVALVRELWDDPSKVKVSRTGTLGRILEDWEKTLADLRARKQDVSDLESRMSPWAAYATGEAMTVREFFLDEQEKALFAYNRWVMEVYNPKQTAYAKEAEREQTRITNEYRMLLGFMAQVTPGDAPYESIDDDNVAKVIDAGRHQHDPIPLKALRIDDRLVRAARLHSEDMTKRGFFDHFAPPNPATGEPGTSPFERMQKQGYRGGGMSENIYSGGGAPLDAHNAWCHSSGHHRNLLSAWEDMGAGLLGKWTQNFGSGGGKPTRVEETVTPR